MIEYRYKIKPLARLKIRSFYNNVAKKYRHTYSKWLMHKNIDDAIDSMFEIERTLLRREPTIERWTGYHMANTDKWYFAYTIDGDTITIVDACHAQNKPIKKRAGPLLLHRNSYLLLITSDIFSSPPDVTVSDL